MVGVVQEGRASVPPGREGQANTGVPFSPQTLYITISPEGAVRIGTCEHCVVAERDRPDRAWEANGDQDLDFDRDTLFANLTELGICLNEREAYVCP